MNPIISEWLTRPGGLAGRLHELRSAAGMSGKDLATAAGWQPPKVSKLEKGRQLPTAADIEAWAAACGAAGEAEELIDLLGEVETIRVEWRHRMLHGQAGVQERYRRIVEAATSVRQFTSAAVPGILQIGEYARRVLTETAARHGVEIDDIDDAVARRMQRQDLLYDSTRSFEFILTEPVLRWQPCTPTVMRAQLDRLLTVFGMPNVRLGIIPLGPVTTIPEHSFVLYDDTAIVEMFVSEVLHTAVESAIYNRIMDQLWDDAVEGDEARQLIIRAADDLRLR